MKTYRFLAAAAAVLAFASVAPAVCADAKSDAQKAITAVYAKMNAAAARKDANGVLAMYTADYVNTDEKGQKHGISELKEMLPQIFQVAKSVKAKTTINKFTMKGKSVIASISDHSEIVLSNPKNPEQTVNITVDTTSEDTWIKTASGWKQKASRTLKSKQLMNGREVTGQP